MRWYWWVLAVVLYTVIGVFISAVLEDEDSAINVWGWPVAVVTVILLFVAAALLWAMEHVDEYVFKRPRRWVRKALGRRAAP